MHGKVGPMFEQRDLEFLGKETLGQSLAFQGEGGGLELIAGGLDNL